jgi:putative phage-type endonuclease
MFGLTESSLYKSLTADLTTVVPQQEEVPHMVVPRVAEIFSTGGPTRSRGGDERIFKTEDFARFYKQYIECTDQEKLDIFTATIGQATKKSWFIARKCRISASKARSIAFARSDDTLFRYFFDSAPDNENFRYGREMEPKAKEEYSNVNSVVVHESGLVICRHFPWLCASPDGLIVGPTGELIVLEVKCPTSGQDGKLDVKNFMQDGQLKKSHSYFAQVQIQLFACDAKVAHFYVFGNCDSKLFTVGRDNKFC